MKTFSATNITKVNFCYCPKNEEVKSPVLNNLHGQWLMPIIPTTWEAEIKRIKVPGQPGQIVRKTPSPK
jgi:hypothetical protein